MAPPEAHMVTLGELSEYSISNLSPDIVLYGIVFHHNRIVLTFSIECGLHWEVTVGRAWSICPGLTGNEAVLGE